MKVTNLRGKKQRLDGALKTALKLAYDRRSDWQKWRLQSISVLEQHLNNGTTCLLLREPPKDGMVVSQHVAETTLKKAMGLRLFLQLMYERDDANNASLSSNTHASVLAERSGALLGLSKTFVYKAYKEWRYGQEANAIVRQKKNDDTIDKSGWFEGDKRGVYERSFILHEEDLKVKFTCWMRKNLRKMSVDLAWEFINSKLLKKIPEENLLAHRISLPICKRTAHQWMIKCGGSRKDSLKTYYNDHHENSEVVSYRIDYIRSIH